MASFFRRFVPRFATIIAPLTELTRKAIEFGWTDKEDLAFTRIKEILSSKPVLGIYNPNSTKTELHTDASSEGLGAILMQENYNKELHPIFAVSRRTSAVERSYHSSKLELMALVWAVERLRVFLLPLKFTILTDCQALVYLNAHKTINPQVVRWVASLSEYNFEIKHRKGTAMQHVDALSRAPVGEPSEEEMIDRAQIFQILRREDEILLYQQHDEKLKKKIDILLKPLSQRTKAENDIVKDYKIRDRMLYKTVKRDNKEVDLYVVPDSMRKALAIKYHDLSSHFGIDKTIARVQMYYYFPYMRTYLRRHIAQCLECILSKKDTGPRPGQLHPIPPGRRPFSVIHVDHVGPFITSNKGSKFILGIIDTLTKFVVFEPVRNTSALLTIKKLEEFVNRFGAPDRIISDRGTCYTAKSFEGFCARHGIHHTLNSSRHPQANGLIERMNRTLLPAMIIRTEAGDRTDWDSEVKSIERDVNASICKATGKTPFESLLGYLPRFGDGRLRELSTHCETYRNPLDIQQEIRKNIEVSQLEMKERYDKHRRANVIYDVGDTVYVDVKPVATGESTKLQRRRRGPYVITQCLTKDTYEIIRLIGGKKRNRPTTAHSSQLKLWRGQDVYGNENLDDKDDVNCDINENDESDDESVMLKDDFSYVSDKASEKADTNLVSEARTEREQCSKDNCDINDSKNKRRVRKRQSPLYLRDYVV